MVPLLGRASLYRPIWGVPPGVCQDQQQLLHKRLEFLEIIHNSWKNNKIAPSLPTKFILQGHYLGEKIYISAKKLFGVSGTLRGN